MSRQIWLQKPTARKAIQLLHVYRYLREKGVESYTAKMAAAYNLEGINQGRGRPSLETFLASILRSKFRFARGKHADNYLSAFNLHAHYWKPSFTILVGLDRHTPSPIVHDKLMEDNRPEVEEFREIILGVV